MCASCINVARALVRQSIVLYPDSMADLFGSDESKAPEPAKDAPLADRLRPRNLPAVVGQEHLPGPEGAIGRMVAAGRLSSIIFWGPPGPRPTTIYRQLAVAVGMRFDRKSVV